MPHFFGSKKLSLGLDIEDDSVRMVELRHTRKGPELVGLGVVELPADKKGSEEAQKKRISSAIKKILSGEKIEEKRVISFISGPSVHTELARMPSLAAEKLREAIKWMMKEKISFDLEETTLDYSVLDKIKENGVQKVEVLAAVAKNKAIQERITLLKQAGLKLAAIDVVPSALLNSFKANNTWEKDEVIALVDIEASSTHLAIIKNAKLKFSRKIAFGGDTITRALKERLNLPSLESALERRRKYGITEKSSEKETEQDRLEVKQGKEEAYQVSQIIKIELGKLVNELQLSFNSYQAQFLEEKIDRIVLSGGTAKLKNLDKFLSANLKVPLEIEKPLDKILVEPYLKKKKYEKLHLFSPSLNIATGLALGEGKGISFSPAKEKRARLVRRTISVLLPSVWFLALFLLLTTGYNFLGQKATTYQQELQSKRDEIAYLQPKVDRAYSLMRDLDKGGQHYKSIIGLRERGIPWVHILAQFSQNIPKKAWLWELSTEERLTDTPLEEASLFLTIKGSIKREGLADDLSLIEFIKRLEESPYFERVWLQSTQRNPRYEEKVIDFTIAAHLLRNEEVSELSYKQNSE